MFTGKTDFSLDGASLKAQQQLHTHNVSKQRRCSLEEVRAAAKQIWDIHFQVKVESLKRVLDCTQ